MALRDTQGRPLVAVTGLGVVTSLGQGKEDTWAALTAGRSGIHRINRFPTEGLRTTIAGTIDSVEVEPFCAPVLSERLAMLAAEEAVGQSGLASDDFPGALFIAVPPVEMEWPQRRGPGPEASGQGRRRHLQGSSQAAANRPLQALARPVHLRHRGRPRC
jgi:3-oxoacyl-[acyl-carrier-protein] synthase II